MAVYTVQFIPSVKAMIATKRPANSKVVSIAIGRAEGVTESVKGVDGSSIEDAKAV